MATSVRPTFKKGKYTTVASGKVMGPVQDVWNVFRPFGQECTKFWKIFKNVEIEAPGNDVQGCIRALVTTKTNRKVRERLEWRDDTSYDEIYSLLSMEPPPAVAMDNVYTTVTMTPGGEKETEVKFECTFDLSVSVALSTIQQSQKLVFMSCISGLQQLFCAEMGTLEVVVGSASNLPRTNNSLFCADPYVVLAVNDNKPVRTNVCRHTQEPIWDERLTVPLTSRTKILVFTIMDRKKVGQDDIMGTAMVSLDDVTPWKENSLCLDVQGGGTLNVRLYIRTHDKPTEAVEEGEKLITEISIPFIAPVFKAELEAIKDEFTNFLTAYMGTGQKYELRRVSRIQSHPDVAMEELPAECVPLPTAELFSPEKFGRSMYRLMNFLQSQAGLTTRLIQDKGKWDPWMASLGCYLPTNERLIKDWQTDEEFCQQYLQGANPMMLTVCNDRTQIPADMMGLKGEGKTTLQLMEENRLFFVDYAPMLAVPKSAGKCFYAPIVLLFTAERSDGKSHLKVLGIQLTRDKITNEIYSPETAKSQPHKYMFAKMHATVADNSVHEFLYHLGYTHSVIEPLVVSLHAQLRPDHPIHRLLLPHFKDTIAINHLARHTIISRTFPLVEPLYATSAIGAFTMLINQYRNYSFMDMAFPEELKRRGFDESGSEGLQGYFYRDDGFKLWNIYNTYVTGVVDRAYTNDQAVAEDQALQRFCRMSEGPGQVHGFPREILTKQLLVDTLTNIIFTSSAQHSALNIPQYDYGSFVPNRPPNLSEWMPDGPNDMLESTILDALPKPAMTALQIALMYLLSAPGEASITKLEAMKDLYPEVHDDFMKQINYLSEEIKDRNEKLKAEGKVPYTYLDPDNVYISIEV